MSSRKRISSIPHVLGVSVLSILLLNACVPGSGDAPASDNARSGEDEQVGGAFGFTFDPEAKSVDVPLNTVVRIQASADLDPETVSAETVRLLAAGGDPVDTKVTYDNGVIEIAPGQALQSRTTYTVKVTTNVRSSSGDQLSSAASTDFTTQAASAEAPLPENFSRWEERMVQHGTQIGDKLMGLSSSQVRSPGSTILNEVYYDGARVFYQIAEYLGATGSERDRWHAYAKRARDIYVQGYLEPNNYVAAGYMRFPHGTYRQWMLDESDATLDSLVKLRDKPTFSRPPAGNTTWYYHKYSREIAYAIQANVVAEKAGAPRQTEFLDRLLDRALTHVDIWTTGNYLDPDSKWHFVQAFMTGLTASALIEYHEHTPDGRIPPAIKTLADWVWDNMWVADVNGSGYGAFKYVNRAVSGVGGPTPAPDLNMLIVPMYAWLYKETGEREYRERADLIFAGGAQLASLHNGKAFNQNYRTSFDYLRWREDGLKRWGQ
ncbi:MAG: Ig-like domain-containing protein [Aquisalimonadaceae bacterium]